jgi:hypothetical protein
MPTAWRGHCNLPPYVMLAAASLLLPRRAGLAIFRRPLSVGVGNPCFGMRRLARLSG